ncbi:hypothetical protein NDU88_002644 [Pleurodeles waltl]|uniref:Uncharacterized protein n=1 Tax=Pleurodeles waltl TaxID=8319 RepID=A0AAV7WSY5_PLEWA|nr:hypothetical protein NDU88_002644 [Pleurodeles waltl]
MEPAEWEAARALQEEPKIDALHGAAATTSHRWTARLRRACGGAQLPTAMLIDAESFSKTQEWKFKIAG